MLKINLLGRMSIEYMGEQLEAKLSTKVLAMIYLLIANKGKFVSKDKLMLYLWPESAEDAARYNLRYNLWTLKKILPETENGESLVNSDKDGCSINDNYPMECDLLTIKSLDLQKASIHELEYVKGLFKGEIMEGWYLKNCREFNELILYDRMTCESRHMDVLRELANRYEEVQESGKALEVLKELSNLEPENEDLAIQIMRLYVSTGNRTAAMNYYKCFEAALWKSLKIAPDEAITSYYESLRRKNLDGSLLQHENSICYPQKETIAASGYCICDVEFFLIADIIYQLEKKIKPSDWNFFDFEVIEDLSSIVSGLMEFYKKSGAETCICKGTGSNVRIIIAFCRFLETLAEFYQVNIQINNSQAIDEMSSKVIEYLQAQEIENLKISF